MGKDVFIAGEGLAKPSEPLNSFKSGEAPLSIYLPAQRVTQNTISPISDGLR